MTYTIHNLTSIVNIPTAELVEIDRQTAVYQLSNGQVILITVKEEGKK